MFKKLLILTTLLTLVSCSSGNSLGKCVGLEALDRDPNLVYEVSVRNALVSLIFIETLIVPVLYVVGDYIYCPVSKKDIE